MKKWNKSKYHKSVAKVSTVLATSTLVVSSLWASSVPSYAKSHAPLPGVTLTGVVDAQISSQQIIATKLGYFKKEGVNVTNKLIVSGPDMLPMIAGGNAPISFQTNFGDIILASSGVKIKIVAPLANISGTQAVVGGPHLVLHSAKDLEGKTIGIPSGADVIFAIQNMCKALGVDITKIHFVTLEPADALTALEKGNIDAMACWEPFITQAIEHGGHLLFRCNHSDLPGHVGKVNWLTVFTTLQVTEPYLQKHPLAIKKILKGLEMATVFINTHRTEAVKILSPVLHIPVKELTQIMSRNIYNMSVDSTYVTNANGSAVMNYQLKAGHIQKIPSFSSYNDFTLLRAVYPTLIQTKLH